MVKENFCSKTIFTNMLQQVTLEIVSIQKRCREQYGLYNNLETPAFKLQIWCSVCLFCNLVFHIITSIDHRYWSILFCKYTYSFHKRRMFESYYYVDGQSKKIIPSKHIEYIQHCLSIDERRRKPKNYCKTHIYKLDYNTKYFASKFNVLSNYVVRPCKKLGLWNCII